MDGTAEFDQLAEAGTAEAVTQVITFGPAFRHRDLRFRQQPQHVVDDRVPLRGVAAEAIQPVTSPPLPVFLIPVAFTIKPPAGARDLVAAGGQQLAVAVDQGRPDLAGKAGAAKSGGIGVIHGLLGVRGPQHAMVAPDQVEETPEIAGDRPLIEFGVGHPVITQWGRGVDEIVGNLEGGRDMLPVFALAVVLIALDELPHLLAVGQCAVRLGKSPDQPLASGVEVANGTQQPERVTIDHAKQASLVGMLQRVADHYSGRRHADPKLRYPGDHGGCGEGIVVVLTKAVANRLQLLRRADRIDLPALHRGGPSQAAGALQAFPGGHDLRPGTTAFQQAPQHPCGP